MIHILLLTIVSLKKISGALTRPKFAKFVKKNSPIAKKVKILSLFLAKSCCKKLFLTYNLFTIYVSYNCSTKMSIEIIINIGF